MCFANRFMLYAAVQLVDNLTTFQNADNVPVRYASGHPCNKRVGNHLCLLAAAFLWWRAIVGVTGGKRGMDD